MAEKIAVDLLINATESARTVKELKQNLKDLKNAALEVGEGSKEFTKITNAAAQAKDKLEGLNDSVNALDPGKVGQGFMRLGSSLAGGFQAATGAAALFGAESKDLEKTLLKVQAATALAQGIQSVQDLGKAFKAFNLIVSANPIGAVIAGLTAVVGLVVAYKDELFGVDSAYQETIDSANKSYEIEKEKFELLEGQTNQLKLQGLSDEQILKLKIKQTDEVIEAREQALLAQKEQADAQLKASIRNQEILEGALKFISIPLTLILKQIDYVAEFFGKDFGLEEKFFGGISKLIFNPDKVKADGDAAIKETEAQLNKLKEQRAGFELDLNNRNAAAFEKRRAEEADRRAAEAQLDAENAALQAKIIADRNQEVKDHEQFERENKLIAIEENAAAQTAIYKQQYDDEVALAANKAAAIQSIEQGSFQILSNLGNLFIKDSQKLQKFQKTLAIAQIAADTAKALMGALSNANSPTADNIATGGLAGIAKYVGLALQITSAAAKAKSILNSGGSSGSFNVGAVGGGSGGGVTGSAGVQLNQVASANTQLNPTEIESGNGSFKVFVTETDITKAQKNISLINNKALVE